MEFLIGSMFWERAQNIVSHDFRCSEIVRICVIVTGSFFFEAFSVEILSKMRKSQSMASCVLMVPN